MSAGGATLEASEPLVGAADSRHLLRTLCGVAGLTLICAAHVPPLYKYVSALLALPHYEYILALPVFAGLLVHSRAWWLGPVIPGYAFGTAAFFLRYPGTAAPNNPDRSASPQTPATATDCWRYGF